MYPSRKAGRLVVFQFLVSLDMSADIHVYFFSLCNHVPFPQNVKIFDFLTITIMKDELVVQVKSIRFVETCIFIRDIIDYPPAVKKRRLFENYNNF